MMFSWTTHSHRIGTLVLIVHDCADHLLELAKMFRYTRYQKTCDAVFVLFAITWVVTRSDLCILPPIVIVVDIDLVPQVRGVSNLDPLLNADWCGELCRDVSRLLHLQLTPRHTPAPPHPLDLFPLQSNTESIIQRRGRWQAERQWAIRGGGREWERAEERHMMRWETEPVPKNVTSPQKNAEVSIYIFVAGLWPFSPSLYLMFVTTSITYLFYPPNITEWWETGRLDFSLIGFWKSDLVMGGCRLVWEIWWGLQQRLQYWKYW